MVFKESLNYIKTNTLNMASKFQQKSTTFKALALFESINIYLLIGLIVCVCALYCILFRYQQLALFI